LLFLAFIVAATGSGTPSAPQRALCEAASHVTSAAPACMPAWRPGLRAPRQVASILLSLDTECSAEADAVLEEAFATSEGFVEPVEEDDAEVQWPYSNPFLPHRRARLSMRQCVRRPAPLGGAWPG